MSKSIELTDLVINTMHIDYVRQCINVDFVMVDVDGKVWDRKEAIFWVTLPEEPKDNWFLLPPTYFPTLLSLQSDADAALTSVYLV